MWLYLNSQQPFNGPTYDEKFIRGVLSEIFGFEKLAKYDMERAKVQFIRGNSIVKTTALQINRHTSLTSFADLLAVRVLNDEERLSLFEGYVAKKCRECKETSVKNREFYTNLKK